MPIKLSDERPYGIVELEGKELKGLLDSGANVSVLGKDAIQLLSELGKSVIKVHSKVSTSDGTSHPIVGAISLVTKYKNIKKPHLYYVVPSLSQFLYLGFDFWKSFNIAPEIHTTNQISEIFTTPDLPEERPENDRHILSEVDSLRLEMVQALFPSSTDLGLGHTTFLTHKIDTGDHEAIKSRHYPVSPKVQTLMYEELDRMLRIGAIEESESPWNSPVVLIRKPGKNRLCLDSRKLNSVTKKLAYGLPNINGLLSRLSDTFYISCIDLKDAFWQVELEESSKEKTAFTVPGRPQYQFRVMPFGLCNAAQRLCQLMDKVFPVSMRDHLSVYLDDLLVFSNSFEEHLSDLTEVARRLRLAGLTVNMQKSRFCYREVKYLGHIIGHGMIRPDPEKISAIENFPVPCSVRQVRRFVGMCGYYGKFIENYSSLSGPLTDTIRKQGKFQMSPEALESFNKLKSALVREPILVHPNFDLPFSIHCDASKYGVGACLMQRDTNGNEKVICYFSKKLTNSQRNYSVTELECLAAVLAVEKFRPYVELHEFTIVTDHSALKWLMSQKDLNGRLARWSLRLQRFEFSIQHRKGQLNVVPDALSRGDDVAEISNNMPVVDLESPAFKSDEYTALIQVVKDNGNHLPDVKVSEGFAYKRDCFRKGQPYEEFNVWKLWLPTELTADLIVKTHESDDNLHLGVGKTIKKLRQLYFWPGLNKQVNAIVTSCEKCKSMKSSNVVLRAEMGQPFEATRPFQHIYIDYLGPYPRSRRGNVYILVVLDYLTKFPIFVPVKNATSNLTVEVLEKDVFSLFNVPETLLSDNGSQFRSGTFKSFLESYGIKHLLTPIYSPQANASERLNRSIIQGIRMQLQADHTRWDEGLTSIAFALRSAVHDSIGVSPHFAMFGTNKICHASAYDLLRKLDCLAEPEMQTDYAGKIQKVQETLLQNIKRAHERNEKNYNLRSRKLQLKPNQEVFRRLFHQSDFAKCYNAKFAPKYAKCRVSKILGNNRVLLEDLKGTPLGQFHTKDIKL